MAPKTKVSPNEVINAYYELKRKREAEHRSLRGLNTVVGDLLGISPQRVGQVIKKYEAELDQVAPKVSKEEMKVMKLSVDTEPGLSFTNEEFRKVKDVWSEKSREAREKLKEAVDGHQGPVTIPEENEPSGGGDSWLSRLNDAGAIKALKEVNRKLEVRIQALEAQLAGLEVPRRGLHGSQHKGAPRRDQVLEVLADGEAHTYADLVGRIGCTGSAVRNAVASLAQQGKVAVSHTKERRGQRVVSVARVQLDKSVSDLM